MKKNMQPFLLFALALAACRAEVTWGKGVPEERDAYECDTSASWRASVIKKFVELIGDEYDVVEGSLDFPPFAQPAGRYGLINLPAEQSPPALCAIAKNVPSPYGPELCNRTVVLGPRDALLGLLCTPPPVRYFGYGTYTVFRFKPSPWLAAAELSDPINQLTINTTAGPGAEDVFRRTAAVISTGDGVTERKVRAALDKAGFPSNAVNLAVVSADRAYFRDDRKLWVRDRSDAFASLLRVSSFVNASEVAPYFKLSWPLLLLRAKRDPSSGLRPPSQPLLTPPPRPQGSGEHESGLQPQLDRLVSGVERALREEQGAALHRIFRMRHITPDIDRCLTDPDYQPIVDHPIPEFGVSEPISTCGFFSRDALYTWMADDPPYSDLTFPADRVYVLVGVNQPLLGKSAYLNIFMTAVAAPQQVNRTFNFSAPDLAGSASRYAPGLPDADKLFAVKLARHCPHGEPYCTTVPETSINLTEYVYVVQRQYLQPSTRIGPAADECLLPLVLAFTLPPGNSSSSTMAVPGLDTRATVAMQ